ncbi:hypothetical protein ACODGR_06465 [Vagococcus fluvialis]|nr:MULTISPECIES: hypothetical protein [Vagococcus]MBO0444285.1 hypothetical protein [Vagococcus fluvialis]MBO0488126.1 hypothetical protein [Vagococcus fluvialis]MCM2139886.1 hypothetical protein [Vagococcus fluvialis]MDT2832129.1 hypothetical protein [Vagococcus carniphilus]MDT2840963.1 hypothetical protein [Vagococcus carniphilus]
MKELIQEIGMALFGLALAIVVFQIAKVGVTGATNNMFDFMTNAFKAVQK